MTDGEKPGAGGIKGRTVPRAAAALRYNAGEDAVPRVVAAGRGRLAVQIEELARAAGVPVYQDPQLAWTLTGLGLNREIGPELYQVVAQVIAWVYYLEDYRKPAASGKTGNRGEGDRRESE